MDVDNIWRKRKEETTKAREKAKATTKKGSTKATKEATTKEGTTRAKEKATQDPKAMDQARATKVKESTAKHDMPPMWQA